MEDKVLLPVGKLVHDTIRHGRFTIIVEQRNYSLYKAETKDALFCVLA